jgi:hypothetical protein
MTERIAPGVYVTADGALHLDIEEMLEAHGFADTPENRETLTRAAHEVVRRLWPGTRIEDV